MEKKAKPRKKQAPKARKPMSRKTKIALVGVGLGVAAALVAGAYFLYGTKKGAATRKKIRGWALRMKGEILEMIEEVRELNRAGYEAIVDKVAARYRGLRNVDPEELREMVRELKGHWESIQKQMEKGAARPVRRKRRA